MKSLRKSSIVFAVLFSVIISNSALAWNDDVTHKALTEMAIIHLNNWFAPYLQNNLGFQKNVDEMLPYKNRQKSILDILKEGSKEEDAWPDRKDPKTARSMNHFHSPITNQGQSGFPGGESALAWARGDSGNNEYSWAEARYHYRLAFEAESATDRDRELADTFRSLGQVMHLVQDMAVPAHTRNGVA